MLEAMGAQLILGAQQILMVLGAQGAQTMNCTIALISLSHGSSFQPKFLFSLDNFKHLLTENRIPSKLKASLLPLNLSQLQQCARLDGQLGTRKSLFQSRRSSDRLRTLNVLSTTCTHFG